MQLTLLTPLVHPSMAATLAPTRGHAAPSREAVAMSQLDRIAAQNLRSPAHGLGSTATLLALLGGLMVLGGASMWHGTVGDEQREARPAALAESRPAPARVTPATPVVPMAAAVAIDPPAPAVAATPESTPNATATPEATMAAVAAAEPAADDAARKARAKQQADARRKAALLAQERTLAEETQRLQMAQQLQQQRDAERAQQQQAEQARQRIAAEQARSQAVQLVLDTRRSVGESCSAAGSLISRQFCRSRECSKSEHYADPTCVNLREDELARQRASIER